VTRSIALVLIATLGAASAAAQTTGSGQGDVGAVPEPDLSPPFWTARHQVLVIGLSASAAAGLVAWTKERGLQAVKTQLIALPAGVPDEWNQQFANANRLLGERDFWMATAIGVGGATLTLAYFFVDRAHQSRGPRGIDASKAIPRHPAWHMSVNLLRPSVSVSRAF